ncbi:hypothetical protein [Nevskia sp.]|uniref:hypothetical protein n=1 Tax=Nevskia sp. TaxID=1929292 RepID=UPI0025FC84BA|nr:hypothetical protein [Nevskia sp.]
MGDIDNFDEHPMLTARCKCGGNLRLLCRRAGQDQAKGAIASFVDQLLGKWQMRNVNAQTNTAIGCRQQTGKSACSAEIVPAEFKVEDAGAAGSRRRGSNSGMSGVSRGNGKYIETVVKHCRSPCSLTRPHDLESRPTLNFLRLLPIPHPKTVVPFWRAAANYPESANVHASGRSTQVVVARCLC